MEDCSKIIMNKWMKFKGAIYNRSMSASDFARSLPTRLLWLFVVVIGFIGGVIIINESVSEWLNNPTMLSIDVMAAQKFQGMIPYPSLTLCRKNSLAVDEYVRTIYDNFELTCTDLETCNKTEALRKEFSVYLRPDMVSE